MSEEEEIEREGGCLRGEDLEGAFQRVMKNGKTEKEGRARRRELAEERKFLVFWIMLMAVSSNFVYNEMDSANKERKEEVPMSMCDQ